MSDFDLTDFLKEGSVANLDWLEVDEKEYRELDRLPKQNLDIGPDLQAIWSHGDAPATSFIPNKDVPRTMGDLSQAHGKLAGEIAVAVGKVARYQLMKSADAHQFRDALSSRFDRNTLQQAKKTIQSALEERGLLGRVYIDSADFDGCHRAPKNALAFVRRFAGEAGYVKAKVACQSCTHAVAGPTGGTNCAVFHKQLVVDVPYTEGLAQKVETAQRAKGYSVEASTDSPKKRVKLAMLADRAQSSQQSEIKPVVNPAQFLQQAGVQEAIKKSRDLSVSRVAASTVIEESLKGGRITLDEARDAYRMASAATTDEELQALAEKVASLEPIGEKVYSGPVVTGHALAVHASGTSGLTKREVSKTASRYMNEGLYGRDLLDALKKRFDSRDLVASREDLKIVLAEQGLQGIYYVDPAAYTDYGKGCREAERLHRSRMVPYVKMGSACHSCVHNREARCSIINKPLVIEPPYTNKAAQQRQVLASGAATSVSTQSLFNNGTSMMAEFELRNASGDIEVNPSVKAPGYAVQFGTGKVKL